MGIPVRGSHLQGARRTSATASGEGPAAGHLTHLIEPEGLRRGRLVYPPDVVADGSLRWLSNCMRLLPALAALVLASAGTEASQAPPPPNRVTVITDSVGGVLPGRPRRAWVCERARPRSRDEDVPGARRSGVPGLRRSGAPSRWTSSGRTVRSSGHGAIDVGYNDQADPYADHLTRSCGLCSGRRAPRRLGDARGDAGAMGADQRSHPRAPIAAPAVVADWAEASAGRTGSSTECT